MRRLSRWLLTTYSCGLRRLGGGLAGDPFGHGVPDSADATAGRSTVVGPIALLGVDAETGVFMLLYLDLAYNKASREGRLRTLADLQATIVEAAKR